MKQIPGSASTIVKPTIESGAAAFGYILNRVREHLSLCCSQPPEALYTIGRGQKTVLKGIWWFGGR
jgi:hypothetical protein